MVIFCGWSVPGTRGAWLTLFWHPWGTRGLQRQLREALGALPAPLLPLPRAGSECPASPAAPLTLQLPTGSQRGPPAVTVSLSPLQPCWPRSQGCTSKRAPGKELDSHGPFWGSSAVGEAVSETVEDERDVAVVSLCWHCPQKLFPTRFAGSVRTHTSLRPPAGGNPQLRAAWISADEEKKQHFAPSGNPNCSAGFSVSRGGLPRPQPPPARQLVLCLHRPGSGGPRLGGPARSSRPLRGRVPAVLPGSLTALLPPRRPGCLHGGTRARAAVLRGSARAAEGRAELQPAPGPEPSGSVGFGGAASPLPAAGRLADMFTRPTGPLVYTHFSPARARGP